MEMHFIKNNKIPHAGKRYVQGLPGYIIDYIERP